MDDDPFRPPVVPTRPPRRRSLWAVIVFLLMLLVAIAGLSFYFIEMLLPK